MGNDVVAAAAALPVRFDVLLVAADHRPSFPALGVGSVVVLDSSARVLSPLSVLSLRCLVCTALLLACVVREGTHFLPAPALDLAVLVPVLVVLVLAADSAAAGFLAAHFAVLTAVLGQAQPLRGESPPGTQGGQALPILPSRPVCAANTTIGDVLICASTSVE